MMKLKNTRVIGLFAVMASVAKLFDNFDLTVLPALNDISVETGLAHGVGAICFVLFTPRVEVRFIFFYFAT